MPPLTIHLSRQNNNNIHKIYMYITVGVVNVLSLWRYVPIINSEDIIRFFFI